MRDQTFTRHQYQVQMLDKSFKKIQRLNPEYSLRQYAKYLKLSHATLSLVFNGKRKLSKKAALSIINKLDLSEKQKQTFLLYYEDSNEPSSQVNEIDHNQFAVISEWQHYGILSLLDTDDFKMNAQWIAQRLNISLTLAKTSIARLKLIGLIEQSSDGKWIQVGGPIRYRNKTSQLANRKFQEQMLKQSMRTLKALPYGVRDHSLIVFAMDPSQVDYAVNRIRQFRYELSTELESFGSKKEVYSLCVQLFPITK